MKNIAVFILLLLLLPFSVGAATKEKVEAEIGAAFQRSEWTAAEKRAFTFSIIAHSLDLASSLASDDRCIERNLILGESPSDGALIGVKVLAIGFEYWLYSSPRFRHSNAQWYGYTSAAIHFAIAASNSQNDCY